MVCVCVCACMRARARACVCGHSFVHLAVLGFVKPTLGPGNEFAFLHGFPQKSYMDLFFPPYVPVALLVSCFFSLRYQFMVGI